MMYSTPGLRMMSWRPGLSNPVTSKPHAARHAMESALSEPFGTAMRSGRWPAPDAARSSAAAAAAMARSRKNAKPAAGRLSPYAPMVLS